LSNAFQKNTTVTKGLSKRLNGDEIVAWHSRLVQKGDGGFEGYGTEHNWTHICGLWELPYAKGLILPHNIDMMHQEHNVAESIISMCFDIKYKTKDNMKARRDLAEICDRPTLQIVEGQTKKPRAPYCVKIKDKKQIFRWLKTLKFTDHYAANIKRLVNVDNTKLIGLKSHDYHIIMERLMPVMFRGYLHDDLWRMLAELSYFYRQLCAKEISKKMMQKLERRI